MAIMNVQQFGAKGDGLFDDTDAIQAAMDAAGANDTVYFPRGRYVVTLTSLTSALKATKSVTLHGDTSPWSKLTDVFGSTNWNSNPTELGAVIESAESSGTILVLDAGVDASRVELQNITLKGIGDNTRTTVGMYVNGVAARLSIRNVTVLNFATGLNLTDCEDGVVEALQVKGCKTGLYVGLNSNSNVLTGLDFWSNETQIQLVGSDNCNFVGGTFEGHLDYGIRVLGGGEHLFSNLYFESGDGTARAMSLEGDRGANLGASNDYNRIVNCHFGSSGDAVDVYTSYNTFLLTKATQGVTLKPSAQFNLVQGSGAATYTDQGVSNLRVPVLQQLRFFNSYIQEVTGNSGITTEFPFNHTGAYLTIPAGTLLEGDRVLVRAVFQCTGHGGATNYIPNIRWGGDTHLSPLLGDALAGTGLTIALNTANHVVYEAWLVFRAVGPSPSWSYECEARSTHARGLGQG